LTFEPASSVSIFGKFTFIDCSSLASLCIPSSVEKNFLRKLPNVVSDHAQVFPHCYLNAALGSRRFLDTHLPVVRHFDRFVSRPRLNELPPCVSDGISLQSALFWSPGREFPL
jgi:hypothetical protein